MFGPIPHRPRSLRPQNALRCFLRRKLLENVHIPAWAVRRGTDRPGSFLVKRTLLGILVAAMLGVRCGADPAGPAARHRAAPLPDLREAGDLFEAGAGDWLSEGAARTGLDFTHFNGMSGRYYFPEMIPGGAGLLDYDNDGDLDVYLVQGHMLGDGLNRNGGSPPDVARRPGGRLFRNDLRVEPDGTRSLRFTDVTDRSGIEARGYGMGVAAGDVDNDGCTDLYLTNLGANQLFRNDCDGTFTDVTESSGAEGGGWSVSAAFVDYDRDGWLDLYVGNYVQYSIETDRPCTGLAGRRDYCTPEVYAPQADRLYRNRGDGRFTDETVTALPGAAFGPALGVSTADFDGDGWIDVYVANDVHQNLLWINQRDGTFRERGLVSGAALSGDGVEEASMGVDAGDFDNDGDFDLFMTHLPTEGNNLYENDGTGFFEDGSIRTGLGPASHGHTGFGAAWLDVDNDGWLDLLAVNGAIEAIDGRGDHPFPYDETNLLFRNLRNGRFEDVTAGAGAAFRRSEISRGAAFGDIDNDGDTDVVVSNNSGPARLLLNEVGNRSRWLGLRLLGSGAQRDMLGARVAVTGAGETRWRHVRTDGSYASAHDPRVLVGLGASAESPRVRVVWASGRVEEWRDLPVDAYTTLTEGQGAAP